MNSTSFSQTTKLISLVQEKYYYQLKTDGATYRLTIMSDDIVRIRSSFQQYFEEESYFLVTTAWDDRLDPLFKEERRKQPPLFPLIEETSESFILKTKTLQIALIKTPFSIRITDLKTKALLYSDLPSRACVAQFGHLTHYQQAQEGDHYYGFGEKSGPLDKKNRRMRMAMKDAIGYDPKSSDPLYKQIPFYIKLDHLTHAASGFFYHSSFEGAFDMGCENSGYWGPYTYFTTLGKDIDLFFIRGPEIREVVRRYTDLTGKSYLPPIYSLGFLGSTMYYVELPDHCDQAIIDFINQNQKEKIPIDGFHLSSGYTVGNDLKRYVFTWNRDRFPDPKEFFHRMKQLGICVSPNIKPGILLTHPHYQKFLKQGAFIKQTDLSSPYTDRWWGGEGSFIDFTNPKGRAIWKQMIQEELLQYGAYSIWNDNCEYEINHEEARCDFDGKPSPSTGLSNVQANLMSHVAHQAIKEIHPDQRPYVICRSGAPGIQRYAQTWAGDNYTSWETLRYNIATILGMGLSGVANQGCDVGGFTGPCPDAPLLVRWVQNGIFFPRFSIHSSNTNNTVTEPWMYEDHTALIRDAIKFRYQMIPYLYSLIYQAHLNGDPIMRPLSYEFQHDRHLLEESFHFMLGESLLVANVVEEGQQEKSVYLPQGSDWYEWKSRRRYRGGQQITFPVTLADIPMFIRDNAVIPLSEQAIENLQTQPIESVRIIMGIARNSSFQWYEDDGVSNRYQHGQYLISKIDLTIGEEVKISFSRQGQYRSKVRKIILEIINEEKGPFSVQLDHQPLLQYLVPEKWRNADSGWYYDGSKRAALISFPNPVASFSVTVSFEKFDLLGM